MTKPNKATKPRVEYTPNPKDQWDTSVLYDKYAVCIRVRERLDGGTPRDPELIHKWVAAKTGYDDEITQKIVDEHMPDIDKVTEGVSEAMWCGFKRDAHGPYVEARQVKALFRESGTMLRIFEKKRGSKQVYQHGMEVKGADGGSKVYFNKVANEGTEERAIHVMTAQGPRDALKKNDYVGAGSLLSFQVWILKTHEKETRHIGEEDLKLMLLHAQENGLGANRSQGCGKFDVVEFGKMP